MLSVIIFIISIIISFYYIFFRYFKRDAFDAQYNFFFLETTSYYLSFIEANFYIWVPTLYVVNSEYASSVVLLLVTKKAKYLETFHATILRKFRYELWYTSSSVRTS